MLSLRLATSHPLHVMYLFLMWNSFTFVNAFGSAAHQGFPTATIYYFQLPSILSPSVLSEWQAVFLCWVVNSWQVCQVKYLKSLECYSLFTWSLMTKKWACNILYGLIHIFQLSCWSHKKFNEVIQAQNQQLQQQSKAMISVWY